MMTMPSPEQMQQDAAKIIQYMSGFLMSKALFSAVSIDLFAHLGREALTVDELAERTGTQERSLQILLNSLAMLELIISENGTYRNSSASAMLLTGSTPADLRATINLFNKIIFPNMTHYETFITEGNSPIKNLFGGDVSPEEQEIMSAGFQQLSASIARALAQSYDFSQHERLIDIAGGTGSFLRTILQVSPDLHVGLFDLPRVIKIAKEQWDGSPHDIAFYEGNIMADDIPDGYDAILCANMAHIFTAEQNQAILKSFRAGVDTGAQLLYISAWTNAEHTQPPFGVLMSMVFDSHTEGSGQAYSVPEVTSWFDATGWRFVEQRPLGGLSSLLIAEAI